MKDPREVIIRPVITEHSYDMMEKNTYTFEVAKDSNKVEIRQAVEAIFNVKVVRVNTINVKPKTKRQLIKWLRNPHSDAAEYKMWGNGVALPCVWFVLSGIVFSTQLSTA